MSGGRCLVLFDSNSVEIDGSLLGMAERTLQDVGLTVVPRADCLVVSWGEISGDDDLALRVRMSSVEEMNEVRQAHVNELVSVDRGFTVEVDDLEEALDETNLLIEVQVSLQEATDGWMFMDWNQTLTGPG